MNIADFLDTSQVNLSLTSKNKKHVLKELTSHICQNEPSLNAEEVYHTLLHKFRYLLLRLQ